MQDKTRTALIEKIIAGDTDEAALRRALMALNETGEITEKAKPNAFLNDKDAREYAGGISRGTLWNWRRDGLKFYNVGSRVFYRAEDISNYIIGSTKARI